MPFLENTKIIRPGTKEDLDTMIDLEKIFFGDKKAEIKEAYEFILEHGRVSIEYSQTPTGMLATIPVDKILQNKKSVLALPKESPFRIRIEGGYLDNYSGHEFVCAFVSKRYSPNLTDIFKSMKKAVGFVYEDAGEALEFYKRLGCKILKKKVDNVHEPGKKDYVLVYGRSV